MAEKRERMKRVPLLEKKRKQALRSKKYRGRTVNLRTCIDEWTEIREEMDLANDHEVAEMLIKCYRGNQWLVGRHAGVIAATGHGVEHSLEDVPNVPRKFPAPRRPMGKRTVGTQTKLNRPRVSSEIQTSLTCKDFDCVRNAFNRHLEKGTMETDSTPATTDRRSDITGDIRWLSLMETLGCATDKDLAKTLMDWFVDTMPLMQLTDTVETPAARQAAETPRHLSSKPYLLTFCVTLEQEQAIRAMCVLKGWPYGPIQEDRLGPVQTIDSAVTPPSPHPDRLTGEQRPITAEQPVKHVKPTTTTLSGTDKQLLNLPTDDPISGIQAQLMIESSGYQSTVHLPQDMSGYQTKGQMPQQMATYQTKESIVQDLPGFQSKGDNTQGMSTFSESTPGHQQPVMATKQISSFDSDKSDYNILGVLPSDSVNKPYVSQHASGESLQTPSVGVVERPYVCEDVKMETERADYTEMDVENPEVDGTKTNVKKFLGLMLQSRMSQDDDT